MNKKPEIVAKFVDRYGDERVVHKVQHRQGRLQVKRQENTICLQFTQAVSALIGKKIKETRIKRGLKLEELASMLGMANYGKSRIWEVENSVRGHGIRIGTLYAIAMALKVSPWDLLPTLEDACELAGVGFEQGYQLKIVNGK